VVRFSSVPNPAKNLNCFVLAVLLPGPDINPRFFGQVVPGPQFHITVPATLPPTKYMTCDRIMTWSIRRLYRNHCSFTSCFQVGDPTNIRWVALKKRTISGVIWGFSIVTQQILVRSYIWMLEVKERLKLDILRTDRVVIQSELKYLVVGKMARLPGLGFPVETGPKAMVRVFRVVRPVGTVRFRVEPDPEPTREIRPFANTTCFWS